MEITWLGWVRTVTAIRSTQAEYFFKMKGLDIHFMCNWTCSNSTTKNYLGNQLIWIWIITLSLKALKNFWRHYWQIFSLLNTQSHFLAARVVDNPHLYAVQPSATTQSNTIEVKIQSPHSKKPMTCNIKLTDQFKVLVGVCAGKLKCDPKKIRFRWVLH